MSKQRYIISKYSVFRVVCIIVAAFVMSIGIYHQYAEAFPIILAIGCFAMVIVGSLMLNTSWIEIDVMRHELVYCSSGGKQKIDISKIDRIVRHISSRGKIIGITIHERSGKYTDLTVRPDFEQQLLSQLSHLNENFVIITYKEQ